MIFFSVLTFLYGVACVLCCILYKEWWMVLSLIPFIAGIIGIIIWAKWKKFSGNAKKYVKQQEFEQKLNTYTTEDLKNKIIVQIKNSLSNFIIDKEKFLKNLPFYVNANIQKSNIFSRSFIPAFGVDGSIRILRFLFAYEVEGDYKSCKIKVEFPTFINKEKINELSENDFGFIITNGLLFSFDKLLNCFFIISKAEVENDQAIFEFVKDSINKILLIVEDERIKKLIDFTEKFED